MMNRPKMLTIKEAAKLVEGLTPFRIRQMCINGELKHIKAGNKYLVNEKVLLDFLCENA